MRKTAHPHTKGGRYSKIGSLSIGETWVPEDWLVNVQVSWTNNILLRKLKHQSSRKWTLATNHSCNANVTTGFLSLLGLESVRVIWFRLNLEKNVLNSRLLTFQISSRKLSVTRFHQLDSAQNAFKYVKVGCSQIYQRLQAVDKSIII